MTLSNAGQRKMTRRMAPHGDPYHDVFMSAKVARNNDHKSKERTKEDASTNHPISPVLRRAAKKQVKTREDRAERRGQL